MDQTRDIANPSENQERSLSEGTCVDMSKTTQCTCRDHFPSSFGDWMESLDPIRKENLERHSKDCMPEIYLYERAISQTMSHAEAEDLRSTWHDSEKISERPKVPDSANRTDRSFHPMTLKVDALSMLERLTLRGKKHDP